MAVDYTYFGTTLGSVIRVNNIFDLWQGTASGGVLSNGGPGFLRLNNIFGTNATGVALMSGGSNTFASFSQQIASWETQVGSIANNLFGTLQTGLNAPNNSVSSIIPLLVIDMWNVGQTVTSNVASVTIAASTNNIGNGSMIASLISLNNPYLVRRQTNGVGIPDERPINEIIAVRCVADQYQGGVAGGETFSMTGWPKSPGPNSYQTPGNGQGPGIQTVNQGNSQLLTNGNFSSWGPGTTTTAINTPQGWNIVSGSAGTSIFQGTSYVHSGTSCLAIVPGGLSGTIAATLTQALTGNSAVPENTYAAGVWLAQNGWSAGTNTGTLTVSLGGLGFGPITLFSGGPAVLSPTTNTIWQMYPVFFNTNGAPPSNLAFEVNLQVSGTGVAGTVFVADAFYCEPAVMGNVQYVMTRGNGFPSNGATIDFEVGDIFTITTTNNNAGVIQSYLGSWYGAQFPSSSSSGATIPDAWAE